MAFIGKVVQGWWARATALHSIDLGSQVGARRKRSRVLSTCGMERKTNKWGPDFIAARFSV